MLVVELEVLEPSKSWQQECHTPTVHSTALNIQKNVHSFLGSHNQLGVGQTSASVVHTLGQSVAHRLVQLALVLGS